MMIKKVLTALMFGLVLAAAGCDKSEGGERDSQGEGEGEGDDDDTDTTQRGAGSGDIEVFNTCDFDICDVRISKCSDSTWGPDRLENRLNPFETAALRDIPSGCYDVRAQGCAGLWEGTATIDVNKNDVATIATCD